MMKKTPKGTYPRNRNNTIKTKKENLLVEQQCKCLRHYMVDKLPSMELDQFESVQTFRLKILYNLCPFANFVI